MPQGTRPPAPDLTNVTPSRTRNGLLVFKIEGTLVPSSAFEIYVDKDRDQSTGDDGDELWLSVFMEGDGKTYYDADRWTGSKWENVTFDVTIADVRRTRGDRLQGGRRGAHGHVRLRPALREDGRRRCREP